MDIFWKENICMDTIWKDTIWKDTICKDTIGMVNICSPI